MKSSYIRNNHMIKLIKLINKSNIIFKRFEAIDGSKLNNNIIQLLKNNNYLTNKFELSKIIKKKSRLGIFLSHILLWSKIQSISNQYTKIIILEDDIFINKNIEYKLNEIDKFIPDDYDILFIGYAGKLVGTPINNYIIKPKQGHFPDTNHGLFGYIINPKSINKLLKIMLPIDNIYIKGDWQLYSCIIPHLDWKIRHFYNTLINAYYLKDPLITHLNQFDHL